MSFICRSKAWVPTAWAGSTANKGQRVLVPWAGRSRRCNQSNITSNSRRDVIARVEPVPVLVPLSTAVKRLRAGRLERGSLRSTGTGSVDQGLQLKKTKPRCHAGLFRSYARQGPLSTAKPSVQRC